MELIIISALPHYLVGDRIVGIAPVCREIDYLADLFGEVRHLAFLHSQPAPANTQVYESGRVQLVPLEPSGGLSIAGKLGALGRAPSCFRRIHAAMQHARLVHVRCPSSVSLEALLLLGTARRTPRSWIKYGGDWRPSASAIESHCGPISTSTTVAATAALLNRQKPIARSRTAWWPGGRPAAKATSHSPARNASIAPSTAPALRRAVSHEPADVGRPVGQSPGLEHGGQRVVHRRRVVAARVPIRMGTVEDVQTGPEVQVVRLREEFHVYMVETSRVNMAGINQRNVDYVVDAIAAVL